MKIALITSFPPSRHALNEYGFHVADQLRQERSVDLTVLGDYLPAPVDELPGFNVTRCWGFERNGNVATLLRAIRRVKPDVAWFNLGFASFGSRPLSATLGLIAPALARLNGVYSHVTLHQLFETVDLEDAAVSSPRLYRMGGWLATHLLLSANSISVLLPAYRRTLDDKYKRGQVSIRSHGIFAGKPDPPDFSRRGNPTHRILAFGKWGTYKRCEMLIEAFEEQVAPAFPRAKLVIAGTNNSNSPGYIEGLSAKYASHPGIEFKGYVEEHDIPDMFGTSSFMVMPYTSATGASGVANLAAAYGVPIVCSDIPDFREMGDSGGLAIKFYPVGNKAALAKNMLDLLQNEQEQHDMAEQNFSAALRMTMPQIIRQYVRAFDRHQRARALEAVSRFRRIPAWVPSRSAIFRASRWGSWS